MNCLNVLSASTWFQWFQPFQSVEKLKDPLSFILSPATGEREG